MSDSNRTEHDLLADFIAAERAAPDPSPEAGARISRRLVTTLALPFDPSLPSSPSSPPTSPAGPVAGAPTGAAGGIAHLSARTLLTFVVGAAVGAGGYATVAHLRQAPAPPPAAPPPFSAPAPEPLSVPPPTLPAPTAPPTAAPPLVPTAPTARAGERPPPAARDRGLAAERKLIEMARTSLARGQTESALATLRHHGRGFPNGQLAEERESLLVQALAAHGKLAEARQHAVRFHRKYPSSLFAPVVDQAVRSIP